MGNTSRGYPDLAQLMGQHVDLALYRRFASLNSRNLLYMQAEIMLIERELWALEFLDKHSGDQERSSFSQNAMKMMRNSGGDANRYWEKVLELRSKLKDYNEALLRQDAVNKLDKAQKEDLEVLQDWLRREEGGNNFLQSFEDRPWGDDADDLVAVGGGIGADVDMVTKWTASTAIPWLNRHGLYRLKKTSPGHDDVGLVEYRNDQILKVTRAMSVIVSSSVPALAVLVLYCISSLVARLAAIVGISLVCALLLTLFTNARPIEIFAGTAALASVQVVFVGSTNIGGTTTV